MGPTATANPIMLDRSQLTPRTAGAVAFDLATAQGPFFLRSQLNRGVIRVGGAAAAQGYAISVASEIPGWDGIVVRTNGATERVGTPAAGAASLGQPGQPSIAY
jgi:hypothetical protein